MFSFNKDIILVDFKKVWWNILLHSKLSYGFVLISEIIINIFGILTPLWWARSFSQFKFNIFVAVFITWLSMVFLDCIARIIYTRFQTRVINSMQYSIYHCLLTIDPIYHVHKSSGILINKIDRTLNCYREFLDAFTFGILPSIVRTSTVLGSLIFYANPIAFIIAILLIGIIFINIGSQWRILRPFEVKLINAQDNLKKGSLETITNMHLIRASFDTIKTNQRFQKLISNLLHQERKFWDIHTAIYICIYVLYLSTVFILGSYLFLIIKNQGFSPLFAIALLGAYIKGTQNIIRLEKPIRNIIRSIIGIKDFFNYIISLGKNSYKVLPVLAEKEILYNNEDCISITFNDITFAYPNSSYLFNKIKLNLQVNKSQQNKFYGIIGASGIGKSTFARILGGQLKPLSGTIKINNTDIYSISDLQRQKLVAMQMQTNTLMQDTFKKNLLLGLPDDAYTHDYLENILITFGFDSIFKTRNGLSTIIGENGNMLSAGQRQKIIFLNLFLRAKFFKPLIVLLDEPTTYLDKNSEKFLQSLIIQLSHDSVILLITHNIYLLDSAYAITDFSSLSYMSEITFINNPNIRNLSSLHPSTSSG